MFPFARSFKQRRLQRLGIVPLLRSRGAPAVYVLCSALFLVYLYLSSPQVTNFSFFAPPRAITPQLAEYQRTHSSDVASGFLRNEDAVRICATQGWKAWRDRTHRRKVYDLIMVNDEMDWLYIRLITLSSVVDYFVIVESPVTFTGLSKSLVLQENWGRFEKWHKQIIYHVLDNPPIGAPRTWDYEDFQRNAMLLQTFGKLDGERSAREGDVLIVADVDEIPRPASILLLRECNTGNRVTLRSQFYYYGFQFRHVGPEWAHPQATSFRGDKTILPADLRNGEGGNPMRAWWEKTEIQNAGWHCSSCFDKVAQILRKMDSFSHTGLNAQVFRNKQRIVDRVRNGLDLWDRQGEVYEKIEDNRDIPEVILADRKKWAYLLDRDGEKGGFVDYK